jgi:hypothetical protein
MQGLDRQRHVGLCSVFHHFRDGVVDRARCRDVFETALPGREYCGNPPPPTLGARRALCLVHRAAVVVTRLGAMRHPL